MFYEPGVQSEKSGWVEVICGSMFSGKTEELIRRVNRAVLAGQEVNIFKPTIDNRYAQGFVVSHNSNKAASFPIRQASEILPLLRSHPCDVVAIDEAQFFDAELLEIVQKLADRGCRVIASGLDLDFERCGFGIMPQLIAQAEYVTKLRAICMKCGSVAMYSFRLNSEHDQVLVGANEAYEARCRACYLEGERHKKQQTAPTQPK